MSLLTAPVDLWQSLLFSWISLPELIRFDIAITSTKSDNNQFHFLFADCHFSFTDHKRLLPVHLDKLLCWLKERKVYFNNLSITCANESQWSRILELTRTTVQTLSISTPLLECVSLYCTKLEELNIEIINVSPQHLQSILRNNASTLKTLDLDDISVTFTDDRHWDIPTLQITHLNLTSCGNVDLVQLVSKCPHLTSLRMELMDVMYSKQLRVFQLSGLNKLKAEYLLTIAQECQEIEFLSIAISSDSTFAGVAVVVNALPNLRKLALEQSSDSAATLELHLIHSQSLQAVEIGGFVISESQFRQFSQACPNLTTLLINDMCLDGTGKQSTLENCPHLTYLQICWPKREMTSYLLQSADIYCPILRTLNLADNADCTAEEIDRVLNRCPLIDKLVLGSDGNLSDYSITDPLICVRVAVTREGPRSLC